MRESSYRDQIYPSFSIQMYGLQRNTPRRLQEEMFASRGLAYQTHGFTRLFWGHIVQQDGISPCRQRCVELGKIFDFHFDFLQVRDGLPGQIDGCSDTASNSNMVVFNEYAVSQTKAMIVPTANPYRVLFEQAETWGCLARINDACPGMPHALHIAPCC